MSFTPWSLIPLWVRAVIILAVVSAVVGAVSWGVHSYNESLRAEGRAEIQAKWDKERAALKDQVQQQKDRNLELQREAEKRYSVIEPVRDHFITKTVTEIRYATQALAVCPVPADAIRLLNGAANCASKDSAASCGAGDGVQPPK